MKASGKERWGRVALQLAGLIAFGLVVANADLGLAAKLLKDAGPILLVGFIPYIFQIGLDSLSWRTILGALRYKVRWRRLLAIRLSTEAVLMSVPAGGIVGETLKPYLLYKSDRVPGAAAVASIGAKKTFLVFAQATYLLLAVVIGWGLLGRISHGVIGAPGLPIFVACAVVFLLVVGCVMSFALVEGAVSARIHGLLMKAPIRRFQAWLGERRAPFDDTDSSFRAIGRASRLRLFAAYGCLVLAWFVETFETWLLLHLIGVEISAVHAFTMEAVLVFVRNMAFFLPAGLGVQDAGYLAFLHAYGVAHASASGGAFVILKRSKEAFWVAVGFLTLFFLQRRVAREGGPEVAPVSTTETA